MLVVLLTFAFGTVTAMLASEMMPSFWSSWIAPWAPQFQLGTGVREVLFMDSGLWTSRMLVLLAEGAIGAVLLAAAAVLGSRGKPAETEAGVQAEAPVEA